MITHILLVAVFFWLPSSHPVLGKARRLTDDGHHQGKSESCLQGKFFTSIRDLKSAFLKVHTVRDPFTVSRSIA